MHKLTKKQKVTCGTIGFITGVLVIGSFSIYKFLPKMQLKDYTAACLYLAVMDDEICRNELEGNTVGGTKIAFPPKIESLQYRYHLFLKLNKKLTTKQMNDEIKKFEFRLEESRHYVSLPKEELIAE